MKQNKKLIRKDMMFAKSLASLAFAFSEFAANSRCMCIYHETEKPEELKKLRKF